MKETTRIRQNVGNGKGRKQETKRKKLKPEERAY